MNGKLEKQVKTENKLVVFRVWPSVPLTKMCNIYSAYSLTLFFHWPATPIAAHYVSSQS